MNINITHIITVSEPLRALLTDLVAALRAAPSPAPAGAVAPAEVSAAIEPAADNGVSLNSPAAAVSPPPAPSSGAAPKGGGKAPYRTPERIDYLTIVWPRGDTAAAALAAMNAMPGPPVPDEFAVLRMVAALRLQRSPAALRAIHLAKVEAMRAAKANGKPVAADRATILRWGAEHGCRQDRLDLPAMNARRQALGQPAFVLAATRQPGN